LLALTSFADAQSLTRRARVEKKKVVHVQIPASAIPTVVDQDASGRTYYEVYLATPNGISNRVLVPCQPANPAPQSAYDLTPDSHDLAIF